MKKSHHSESNPFIYLRRTLAPKKLKICQKSLRGAESYKRGRTAVHWWFWREDGSWKHPRLNIRTWCVRFLSSLRANIWRQGALFIPWYCKISALVNGSHICSYCYSGMISLSNWLDFELVTFITLKEFMLIISDSIFFFPSGITSFH